MTPLNDASKFFHPPPKKKTKKNIYTHVKSKIFTPSRRHFQNVSPPLPIDYEASRRVPDFLLPKLQIERAELDIFLWSEEPEGGGWLKFRRWSVKILPPDINSGTYLISIFTCNLQHQMQISDHIVYYRESSNSLSKVPAKKL